MASLACCATWCVVPVHSRRCHFPDSAVWCSLCCLPQIGVMPIFFAYATFAVVYFGSDVPRFGNFQYALVTLFAVLNGDVIRETFMTLVPIFPVVGQLFMYTFVALFIYVVLNIFIAIIEESFFFVVQRSIEVQNQVRRAEEMLAQQEQASVSTLSDSDDSSESDEDEAMAKQRTQFKLAKASSRLWTEAEIAATRAVNSTPKLDAAMEGKYNPPSPMIGAHQAPSVVAPGSAAGVTAPASLRSVSTHAAADEDDGAAAVLARSHSAPHVTAEAASATLAAVSGVASLTPQHHRGGARSAKLPVDALKVPPRPDIQSVSAEESDPFTRMLRFNEWQETLADRNRSREEKKKLHKHGGAHSHKARTTVPTPQVEVRSPPSVATASPSHHAPLGPGSVVSDAATAPSTSPGNVK